MAQGYKTGGREAGTPNKATSQMREAITKALTFIDGDPMQFQSDIEALTPSERLKFYISLLEYVQPKLARTDLSSQGKAISNFDVPFYVEIISGKDANNK